MKIVNTAGTVVATYAYDAWGKVLSESGTMAYANPIRYRGYYYDTEGGLYYCQSRYYDPVIGRWVNADVVMDDGAGVLQGNLYAYCGNNPVMYFDPDGHAKVYVIYYNNPGSGFKEQAMNSP